MAQVEAATYQLDQGENSEAGPSSAPHSPRASSASSSRSPTPPLTPPEPLPELPGSLLQSIYTSYPLPIQLPFPPSQVDPSKRTVCKHWLRGLCKKSDATCDYLHEYDMRKMPECRMFATFGFCNAGDDCLYRHKLPREKRRECEDYARGFCPRGPDCGKKHIRAVMCPYYLAGFCPKGPDCKQAHPKSNPPSAQSRRSSPVLNHKPLTAEEAFGPPPHLREQQQQQQGSGGGGGQHGSAVLLGGMAGGGGPGSGPGQGRMNMGMSNRSGPPGAGAGGAGGGGAGGGGGGGRRDLSSVLCFKCGEHGHFANACPNPNRPGNRGGTERGSGGRERRF
ncbi:unnamed protein product [Parajaminaea phylloscopi]